jgi:cytochrome P450 family 4
MALLEINVALLSSFFIGILLLLIYWSRWSRYYILGMNLPGPPALPIVGNIFQFTSNDLCKLFKDCREMGRMYGPIARVWIGPILVVGLADADNIESVVKHDKLCTRGYIPRKLMKPAFLNGLVNIDGDDWRRHRKIVSAAFHINTLETFVETFAKSSDILANNLKALADGVTAHDIAPYLMRCTLDIIVQTSYKAEIDALNGNDDSTLNNITTIVDITVMRLLKPWLYIEWIFKATELGKKYYKAMQCEHVKINNEIRRIKRMREIAETRGQKYDKPSLMVHIIQYGDINKEEIVEEIFSIIGAGTETTSTACGYVLALFWGNQNIQARAM